MRISKVRIAKYTITVLVCLTAFLGLASTAVAEEVESFSADITVNSDSSITVTETIRYDFEDLERHGIFRNIPVSYETNTGNRRIFVDVVSVAREGNSAEYSTSRSGDDLEIKVGDPDREITGSHMYKIIYEVRGALNYFEDTAELYWNVTGSQWEVPIQQAQALVNLPDEVASGDLQTACYSGPVGSDQECASIQASTSTVTARAGTLPSGEGLTVAVRFPDTLVEEPGWFTQAKWWLSANFIVLFPFGIFFLMVYLWYTRGRDPEGRGTIMARYTPPEEMKPTMIGSLIDEKVHDKDITAGIIYLAKHGYLRLRRLEGTKLMVFNTVDYELTLEEDVESIPTETEKDIAEIIFGSEAEAGKTVNISDLKDDTSVAKKIKNLKDDVYKRMVERELFAKNPRKVIGWYWGIGFAAIWVLVILAGFTGASFVSVIAGIVSGMIIVAFGYFMPQKTKKGVLTHEHLQGFKHFLTLTQKERMEFHDAPERSPEEFMEYLPHAIALGVEEEWAEQFSDIYITTPDWYEGDVSGRVAATALASDLSDATGGIAKGVSSAASAADGSSGVSGGASGGGMGGGGGGSW